MEEQEKEIYFIKGFNNGYLLNIHEPELLDGILKSGNHKSDYVRAMALGKKQHEKEQLMDEMKQSRERQRNIKRGR
ncbi:hypothetical protein [Rufibacter quisquiliarum]|uniref:Uncharacterized protein n=1 Tax=Rufibacter quisquiliarum TaxID=1549639 RepID=A0A839GNQ0_9BACT|nr:hypothetical protein [Rufibacter quisquiliarum]MBA9076546.1 hypothetical protein [Rufibacter quisquiliarum]